jgi:alkylhydroperoxidase family enzyme
VPTSRRLTPVTDRSSLDTAQERLWRVVADGPRGRTAVRDSGQLTGPFDVLLRSPETGVAVAELGAQLRYASSLDGRETELVILLVAGRYRAGFAWVRHVQYGLAAGVTAEQVSDVAAGRPPAVSDEPGRLVVELVGSLLDTGHVGDTLYAAAVEVLGVRKVVDVVALTGYYTLSSYLLNTFDVPLPSGERLPWRSPTDSTPSTEAPPDTTATKGPR